MHGSLQDYLLQCTPVDEAAIDANVADVARCNAAFASRLSLPCALHAMLCGTIAVLVSATRCIEAATWPSSACIPLSIRTDANSMLSTRAHLLLVECMQLFVAPLALKDGANLVAQ
eukprot:TRINITY_DN23729_c0_g3_i3.p1 TRINITY_DN23729_c0_g3~~TRINITY_DN23729_c0_g3_i3.p1  ORF type:complete len:116 (+),score=14.51 TRINITY_DN23729_c0_g3_i3:415-762(+)